MLRGLCSLVALLLGLAGSDAFLAPGPAASAHWRASGLSAQQAAGRSSFSGRNLAAPATAPQGIQHGLIRGSGLRSRRAVQLNALQDPNALPAYSKFGQIKIKGKDFSIPIGLCFILGSAVWAVVLFPFVLVAYAYSKAFDELKRRAVDFSVSLWAKGAMLSLCYWPTLIGKENLPPDDEPVMYIPNHCSYLDIFTLSGTVPRAFKYMSKQEILAIPIIGWAMQMAGHIGIKRMDKRSQLEAFKAVVDALKKGNSVVTFAEGTRSPDGRLQTMKSGAIKMAQKAGVRIVPVSICNLYKWMPTTALTPMAFPQRVEVKIHPPVDPAGKTEEELLEYVYDCVNEGLPEHQKNIPKAKV